jgi:5-methylcytosine-specific restriction endonuclease McrA
MEPDRAKLRLIRTGAPADTLPNAPGPADAPPYFPDHADSAMPVRLDAVRLLSLDAHGRVLDWMSWQDATCLYARGAVAWTLGDPCLTVHGGICRLTGERSTVDLHPIVAARGHARTHALDPTPALTNAALFARDEYLCLYCGRDFHRQQLTRDHVMPLSKGGRDTWENVVAACFHCNSRKRACRCWRCRTGRAGSSI